MYVLNRREFFTGGSNTDDFPQSSERDTFLPEDTEISRRDFMAWVGGALASLSLAGCATVAPPRAEKKNASKKQKPSAEKKERKNLRECSPAEKEKERQRVYPLMRQQTNAEKEEKIIFSHYTAKQKAKDVCVYALHQRDRYVREEKIGLQDIMMMPDRVLEAQEMAVGSPDAWKFHYSKYVHTQTPKKPTAWFEDSNGNKIDRRGPRTKKAKKIGYQPISSLNEWYDMVKRSYSENKNDPIYVVNLFTDSNNQWRVIRDYNKIAEKNRKRNTGDPLPVIPLEATHPYQIVGLKKWKYPNISCNITLREFLKLLRNRDETMRSKATEQSIIDAILDKLLEEPGFIDRLVPRVDGKKIDLDDDIPAGSTLELIDYGYRDEQPLKIKDKRTPVIRGGPLLQMMLDVDRFIPRAVATIDSKAVERDKGDILQKLKDMGVRK